MRKLVLGIAMAATVLASSAKADEWNRGGFNPNNGYGHYGYGHREWRGGGGGNGGAIIGGLVGGMILGGMLNQMAQPRYVQPQYVDPDYQPVCQRIVTGQYWNGWQWVYRTQVVCQ